MVLPTCSCSNADSQLAATLDRAQQAVLGQAERLAKLVRRGGEGAGTAAIRYSTKCRRCDTLRSDC